MKRLRILHDKMKQRAEVAVYFKRYDEAEALYREIDRKDLAIELRIRLGQWFRVLQLLQSGGGSDELLTLTRNKIGDHFVDRQKWTKAVPYYKQAKNTTALVKVYYVLEDYTSLQKLVSSIPDGSEILMEIAEKVNPDVAVVFKIAPEFTFYVDLLLTTHTLSSSYYSDLSRYTVPKCRTW